jgi:uncharacterized BrkB/YihY/UPF0761 family membrane protein
MLEWIERASVGAARVRREIPAADAGWETFTEDLEIGGPLISGAVAFRFFLWLLPFTLLTIVGFGLLADAGGRSASSVAHQAGIRGIAAQSIESATSASTGGRWILVFVALIALFSTSRALVKALWRSHEMAWRRPRTKPPRAFRGIGTLLAMMVVAFLVVSMISRLRMESSGLGIGVALVVVVVWSALWFVASSLLPRGDAPWTALVPGALFVVVTAEMLRLVTVYYLAGKVGSSSAVYGGLGAAAALLGWLYLLARAMVLSAILNATLWQRRGRGTSSGLRRAVAHPPASDESSTPHDDPTGGIRQSEDAATQKTPATRQR